jgi:hypothetical protein
MTSRKRSFRSAFWHWARLVTLSTVIGLIAAAFGAHGVKEGMASILPRAISAHKRDVN